MTFQGNLLFLFYFDWRIRDESNSDGIVKEFQGSYKDFLQLVRESRCPDLYFFLSFTSNCVKCDTRKNPNRRGLTVMNHRHYQTCTRNSFHDFWRRTLCQPPVNQRVTHVWIERFPLNWKRPKREQDKINRRNSAASDSTFRIY